MFRIDRTKAATPRRNIEVKEALNHGLEAFSAFLKSITSDFMQSIKSLEKTDVKVDVDFPSFLSRVLDPILPLFNKTKGHDDDDDEEDRSSTQAPVNLLLDSSETSALLEEESRSLQEVLAELTVAKPALFGIDDAKCYIIAAHLKQICDSVIQSINFVEEMLYKQLRAAIGKDVSTKLFEDYMAFDYLRLFAADYRPSPFSHLIRRSPQHSPEGLVSIEYKGQSLSLLPSFLS
jgi:hypothetical protein